MNTNRLHIVAFDIPYPPTYGGAIDVYYRIKALHEQGIHIILHCTYKGELTHYNALEQICEKVFYYPRNWSIRHLFSRLPLTVQSRDNTAILKNLMQDTDPILYEGLVSCGTLSAPELRNRKKFFRECNVEHDYYLALSHATHSIWKKLYFRIEARRLKHFESVLNSVQGIFALAHQDEAHFKAEFPNIPTHYLPCFHANQSVSSPIGIGSGILYHGNLNVAENRKAAEYILKNIAPQLPSIPFVIAGRWDGHSLSTYSNNVQCIFNPDDRQMQALIEHAQVHLLITFQATGLKLKLLNVLYQGRHVVCNEDMVCGTELADACHVAVKKEQIIELCQLLYTQPFLELEYTQRVNQLQSFGNTQLVQLLISTILL